MRWCKWATLALLLAVAGGVQASDPIGIYARVDRVVFEPPSGKPERIQVWGAFSLAKGRAGEDYNLPLQGYMYFRLPGGNKDAAARNEWTDLKKVAGTGQCVGFASRFLPKGTVRRGEGKPARPDPFPTGFGMHKVDNGHPTARLLRSLPVPRFPGEGQEVDPGAVTIRAGNMLDDGHKEARYVFEISGSDGGRERSKLVAAGKTETSWTPRMKVRAGVKYTWTVQAVDDDWKGPVALAMFKGKSG
jgi:hypothetical protein